jgi:hypothetical protein
MTISNDQAERLDLALALLASAASALHAAGLAIQQVRDAGAAPLVDDGVCRHGDRLSVATHGRPGAWMCKACGYEGGED